MGAAATPGGADGTGRAGRRRLQEALLPLVGTAGLWAVWWLATEVAAPPHSFLARFAPAEAWRALLHIVGTGAVAPHALASLWRIGSGLALAALAGLPMGLALGGVPALARLLGPPLQLLRMISPLSWTPMAIVLFGVGSAPVIFLVAMACVWPIALNTAAGVRSVDGRWLLVARSLGATRWEAARTVIWPALRPAVRTGMRLAVGLAWVVVVPAEMLGVDSGLGYFVLDTRDRLAYGEMVATILLTGLIGLGLDVLARWALREGRAS